VSILPSAASLKALRVFAKEQSTKPMTGFGDPISIPAWSPATATVPSGRPHAALRPAPTRISGGRRCRSRAAGGCAFAIARHRRRTQCDCQNLGVAAADIHLGEDASETTLKRTSLADYGIVYFATHGLVAGDVKGLAEPSLVLSIPKQPSEFDDGLLTASEVGQLKLNADWVVLSACNTIAGDKPGAEALSGLARSFFLFGARALLSFRIGRSIRTATRPRFRPSTA
jgi:hypothetical protein